MLTVKGYFEDGAVQLPDEVKNRKPGPVLVVFLDEEPDADERVKRQGLVQFAEAKQRPLDSTVIPREQFEQHQEEKALRASVDSQVILRRDTD